MGQWQARWAEGMGGCLTVALCCLAAVAPGAGAASETTNCVGLQAALDQAITGDTITLDQLCAGQEFSLSNGASDSRSYTLAGQSGSGAGFDGTGAGGRVLSATGAAGAPSALTLRNLIFENGVQPSTGGAVAFQGEYSVTLDHDTFTNNEASPGPGGAVDVETSAPSAVVKLTGDSFANDQAPGGAGLGGAVNISALGASGTVVLDGDTFTSNHTGLGGGAVEFTTYSASGSLTVTNSTFSGNVAQDTGGALDICECAAPLPVTLTNNAFSANKLTGVGACGCELDGGAVFVDNSSGGTGALTQSGNTFSGNSISGGTGDVHGGGEASVGMGLSSRDDTFTGNSIQAPAGASAVAEGAAQSVENSCAAAAVDHTASNLVVAGNSIADGGVAVNARGAFYDGCASGTVNLTLRDATVSGNRGGGGTAGVWGNPSDQLTLQNSILAGDSDGAELAGFGGSGGSVTASFTDLCSGSSPFAGTGNICADPLLAGAAGGDVHETSASPTIDAGSNSLVPGGLSTDIYGATRIQPRVAGGAPVVDMGAAESPSVAAPGPGHAPGPVPGPSPGPRPSPGPPDSNFIWLGSDSSSSDGSITVMLEVPGSGTIDVLGTQDNPRTGFFSRNEPGRNRFAYGRIDKRPRHGGRVRIRLKPNRKGRWMFRRNRRLGWALHIRVWVTYTAAGGHPRARSRNVRVLRMLHRGR